jgi:transposase
MLAESHDEENIIGRVAALDIGKSELVYCVRIPGTAGRKAAAGGIDAFHDAAGAE